MGDAMLNVMTAKELGAKIGAVASSHHAAGTCAHGDLLGMGAGKSKGVYGPAGGARAGIQLLGSHLFRRHVGHRSHHRARAGQMLFAY
jgi:hypothetical protein